MMLLIVLYTATEKKSPFVGREVQKRAHRAAPSRRVSGEPWKKPIAIIAPGPK